MIGPYRLNYRSSHRIEPQKKSEGSTGSEAPATSRPPQQTTQNDPLNCGINLGRVQGRTGPRAVSECQSRRTSRRKTDRKGVRRRANVPPTAAIQETTEASKGDADRQCRCDDIKKIAGVAVAFSSLQPDESQQPSSYRTVENQTAFPQPKDGSPVTICKHLITELNAIPRTTTEKSKEDQGNRQVCHPLFIQPSATCAHLEEKHTEQNSEKNHRSITEHWKVAERCWNSEQLPEHASPLSMEDKWSLEIIGNRDTPRDQEGAGYMDNLTCNATRPRVLCAT